jgi:hypothetical protein
MKPITTFSPSCAVDCLDTRNATRQWSEIVTGVCLMTMRNAHNFLVLKTLREEIIGVRIILKLVLERMARSMNWN